MLDRNLSVNLRHFVRRNQHLDLKKKNVFSQLSVFGYLCVFPALETIFFYVVDLRDIVVHCAAETTLSKDYINFVHTHLHQGILRARRDFIPKVVQFPLALSIQTLGLHCTTVVVPAMCTCSISVGLNLLFHESKQLASVCQFICHCSVCFQPWQQTQSPFLACQWVADATQQLESSYSDCPLQRGFSEPWQRLLRKLIRIAKSLLGCYDVCVYVCVWEIWV